MTEEACEILCSNLDVWFATLEAGVFAQQWQTEREQAQRRLQEEGLTGPFSFDASHEA